MEWLFDNEAEDASEFWEQAIKANNLLKSSRLRTASRPRYQATNGAAKVLTYPTFENRDPWLTANPTARYDGNEFRLEKPIYVRKNQQVNRE